MICESSLNIKYWLGRNSNEASCALEYFTVYRLCLW